MLLAVGVQSRGDASLQMGLVMPVVYVHGVDLQIAKTPMLHITLFGTCLTSQSLVVHLVCKL